MQLADGGAQAVGDGPHELGQVAPLLELDEALGDVAVLQRAVDGGEQRRGIPDVAQVARREAVGPAAVVEEDVAALRAEVRGGEEAARGVGEFAQPGRVIERLVHPVQRDSGHEAVRIEGEPDDAAGYGMRAGPPLADRPVQAFDPGRRRHQPERDQAVGDRPGIDVLQEPDGIGAGPAGEAIEPPGEDRARLRVADGPDGPRVLARNPGARLAGGDEAPEDLGVARIEGVHPELDGGDAPELRVVEGVEEEASTSLAGLVGEAAAGVGAHPGGEAGGEDGLEQAGGFRAAGAAEGVEGLDDPFPGGAAEGGLDVVPEGVEGGPGNLGVRIGGVAHAGGGPASLLGGAGSAEEVEAGLAGAGGDGVGGPVVSGGRRRASAAEGQREEGEGGREAHGHETPVGAVGIPNPFVFRADFSGPSDTGRGGEPSVAGSSGVSPYQEPICITLPIILKRFNEFGTTSRSGIIECGRVRVDAVTVWGDFEVHLDRLLGRGGMGSVYRAWQRSLGRWVAVKVLDTVRGADTVMAQGFLQKFKVEIAALAKLNDPRIVSIIQAGENDGRCWFAMEFLEGKTLEARIGEAPLLSEAEARRIGAEIARALDAAWKAGIVHRDVKPGNVFLLKEGAVKIADFGLARSEALGRTRLTDAGAFACTPAYASPEQIEGRATDHRSDIYSLGCVLYEMATQRPPFLAESPLDTFTKHKFHKPASLVALNPAISTAYEDLVLRCLEKHPDDRWGGYADLIDALAGRSSSATALPLAVPRRRGRGLAMAALAGTAVFGWVLTTVLRADVPAKEDGTVILGTAEPMQPPLPPVAPSKPAPVSAPVLEKPVPPRPSAEDVTLLESVLEASRASLTARTAYDFAGAEARMVELEHAVAANPWVREQAAASVERLRAAARAFPPGPLFKPGVEATVLLRDGRTVRGRIKEESAEGVRLEGFDGRRILLARAEISPATFPAGRDPRVRAGAGDALGTLGDLGEPHAAGLADQAIEEVLRAAGAGDFRPLQGLKFARAQREALEPALGPRLRLLEEERAAAELKERGALAELLLEKPLTRAAARAAAEALDVFQRALPMGGDAELVGEVPWATWEPDTFHAPGAVARFDATSRAYVLAPRRPGDVVWLKKPFEGARQGYRVVFRFPSLDEGARLTAAITFTRWIEIGPGEVLVKAVEEGKRARTVKRVTGGHRLERGCLTVAPAAGLTLVWLDDALLFALPAPEYAHEAGMQLGAVGGPLRIESIRVKDRSR